MWLRCPFVFEVRTRLKSEDEQYKKRKGDMTPP